MVWDQTQPTDTTKIRNLGVVIRPNWLALKTGDSSLKLDSANFDDRTVAGLADDPTAIADAYVLYCKTDAAGNSELYGIDESSNKLQFTQGAPTLAAQGKIFLPGGLLMQWNTEVVATGGAVTFLTPFSAAAYSVQFMPTGSSGTNRIFYRLNGNPTDVGFSPIMVDRNNNALTEKIYYLAIGPA